MSNGGLQSLFKLLRKRRSIRVFKKKGINSRVVLMTILQACDMAPSSGGLQTYEIYYVKNYDRRRKLVSAAHNQEFVAEAPLLLYSFLCQCFSLGSQVWQEVSAVLCSGCNDSSRVRATCNIRIRSYDCVDRRI
ncbi:MAG: nitroreductase family protein [Nitrososphaeraceae archaeon]